MGTDQNGTKLSLFSIEILYALAGWKCDYNA